MSSATRPAATATSRRLKAFRHWLIRSRLFVMGSLLRSRRSLALNNVRRQPRRRFPSVGMPDELVAPSALGPQTRDLPGWNRDCDDPVGWQPNGGAPPLDAGAVSVRSRRRRRAVD